MFKKNSYILFVLFVCYFTQHKAYAQQEKELKFEHQIVDWLLEDNVPMIGVGIIEQGKVIHTKVYDQHGKSTAKLNNTLFDIASLTKTITAITALNIIQNKSLELDEPIYKYYVDHDLKDDPRHKNLTIRHILSHQTGFPNWRFMTPSKKLKFNFEPGERYAYSGEGYEYLRHVLEAKRGTSFDDISDSTLFSPLGMSDTQFYWDGSFNETQFAMGHDRQGNKYNKGKRKEINAAAGAITTIGDYTKFCSFVLNGAGLSSELYAEMITPQTHFKNDLHYGLGWAILKSPSTNKVTLFHFGRENGISTFVLLLPEEKAGMALFTNSDNGQYVYEKVIESYFPNGKEILDLINKKTVFEHKHKLNSKELTDYIGTYKKTNDLTIEILIENGVLKFNRPGVPLYEMYAQTEDKFILDEELSIKFMKDTSGKNVSILIFLNGVELFQLNKVK